MQGLTLHVIRIPYSEPITQWLYLSADWHVDAPDFDEKMWRDQHDEARQRNARCFCFGDLAEYINDTDRKRYNKAADPYQYENEMFEIRRRLAALLEPYADLYDLIGVGNHEVSALRYARDDMVRALLFDLNAKLPEGHRIRHGGYAGFIRIRFAYTRGSTTQSYDIFFDHGQGGEAEVTRGEIDLSRYAMWADADMIVLGHKHQYKATELPPLLGLMDRADVFRYRPRRGVIVSPYKRVPVPAVYDETGYVRSYQVERKRVPAASRGGVFIRLDLQTTKGPIRSRVELL